MFEGFKLVTLVQVMAVLVAAALVAGCCAGAILYGTFIGS